MLSLLSNWLFDKGEAPAFVGTSPSDASQLLGGNGTQQSFHFLVENPGRRSAYLAVNQLAI